MEIDNKKTLYRELKEFVPHADLQKLHIKSPNLHLLIAFRQLILLIALPFLIIYFQKALYISIPLAIAEGFVIFSFTILLHEVIHDNVYPLSKTKPKFQKAIGKIYASITGMSYNQFSVWHLDHHKYLGHNINDPKKAQLSPKKNKRWLKLLYGTPALFFIYFAAVKKTIKSYPVEVRKKIRNERTAVIGIHLSILSILLFTNPVLSIQLYIIPVFFGFPLAFFINRMGQHYVIDPSDPAKGSTLMSSNKVWDFIFLYSTYHLEHHYYPGIPFYNLKKVNGLLKDFYAYKGMEAYTYTQLLSLWMIKNHYPHTKPIKN